MSRSERIVNNGIAQAALSHHRGRPAETMRAECAAIRSGAEAPPSFVMMGSGVRIPLAAPEIYHMNSLGYGPLPIKLVSSFVAILTPSCHQAPESGTDG